VGAVGAVLVTVAALAGCTSSAPPPKVTTQTLTQTVASTHVSIPTGGFRPEPVKAVAGLPPGDQPGKGEKDGRCPYIRTGQNQDPPGGVNMADLEGDRIYRTTRLTRYHPVGCRFYFIYGAYEAVADIRPFTLATPTEAYNAMVLTARTGHNQIPERNFVKGLTGISFQTRDFAPDGRNDWAFAFAKGRHLVVVYTQRADTSRNAVYIAQAIAGKF
jgi:hypothetical protein